MKTVAKLTAKRLRQLLHYNPDTGEWRRAANHGRHLRYKAGEAAGHLDKKQGYLFIRIDYKLYLAHRLAWLYMLGKWPAKQVDHINLNRTDNRWNNLREASHGQNVQNSSLRKNNTTGFKGVHINKNYPFRSKYVARITVKRKEIYLGNFTTAEEAHAAYMKAAKRYFREFARAR